MKNKPTQNKPCLFVNLAEKIAIQNQIVVQTMDEIIERSLLSLDESDEKHTSQVQKTIDATQVKEATSKDTNRKDLPRPKVLSRRASNWMQMEDSV